MTLVSECDISVSKTSRFRNYSNCWDGIGIGFENFWFKKKYRYRFRKILVSKKVSVSVSEKNRYRKKYRIRYRKNLVSEKSFGFGFVQILGIVTHCLHLVIISWKVKVASKVKVAKRGVVSWAGLSMLSPFWQPPNLPEI